MNTTSIPCTSIENELEYHYLYVRFNSSNGVGAVSAYNSLLLR